MTKEKAIEIIRDIIRIINEDGSDYVDARDVPLLEFIDTELSKDVVLKAIYEECRSERDIAIKALEENGLSFGEYLLREIEEE